MVAPSGTNDSRALLAAWRGGDLTARERLLVIFYPELRRAAAALLRQQRGVSLSTRDLIHETILRLIALDRIRWEDEAHFRALSATMMRRALLDHLRARRRLKRDGAAVTLLTDVPDAAPDIDTEALNHALDRLSSIERSHAEIVEMRYFGGMEIPHIATVLSLSESTVKRRWAAARLWLAEALQE